MGFSPAAAYSPHAGGFLPLDWVMLALPQHRLAGRLIAGFAFLWRELVRLRERMDRLEVSLRERMARLEGLFEGFTKRESAGQ